MAKNYMDYLRDWGSGSSGAAGTYANLNKQFPGVGKALDSYGQFSKAQNIMGLAQRPTLRNAASTGLNMALEANPYYRAFNMLTGNAGGKAINRLFNRPKKGQDLGLLQDEVGLDDQTRMAQDAAYKMASSAAEDAALARERSDVFRATQRNLAESGPSARELAPLLGRFSDINTAAAGAARSGLAQNLSQRGLGGGLAAGAMAGLEGSLAASQGQQRGQLASTLADQQLQMQQQLFAADQASRESALNRQMAAQGAAAALPFQLANQRLAQRQQQALEEERRYQRRQGEMEQLGALFGTFGPELFDLFKKRKTEGQVPVSDFGTFDGMPVASTFDGGQFVVDQNQLPGMSGIDVRDLAEYMPNTAPFVPPVPVGADVDTTQYYKSDQFLGQLPVLGEEVFSLYPDMMSLPEASASATFKRPVSVQTSNRLNIQFAGTRTGQSVYDPATRQSYLKTRSGWSKR
jgi:hypothetical protein